MLLGADGKAWKGCREGREVLGRGVLRFRLTRGCEEKILRRWGSIEEFQRCVNEASNVKYTFEQKRVEFLAGQPLEDTDSVIVSGPVKLIVGYPYDWDSLSLQVIKNVADATEEDRKEASGYRPLDADLQFLPFGEKRKVPTLVLTQLEPKREAPSAPTKQPPTGRRKAKKRKKGRVDFYPLYKEKRPQDTVKIYCETEETWHWMRVDSKRCTECGKPLGSLPACPNCGSDLIPQRGAYCSRCGAKLAPALAVPREIVFSLQTEPFLRLSASQVEIVEAVADRLRRGRDERRTIMGPVLIVHLELRNERDCSTLEDVQKAKQALEQLGVGTILDDEYELNQVRKGMGLNLH
jgi:hypothetical protein